MPIYEYKCYDCREKVDIFFRSFAQVEAKAIVCPKCRGTNLERLISKTSVVHAKGGTEARLAGTVPAKGQPGGADGTALARSMREASRKAGQDFGSQFNEVASRLERGEKPASIEKSLRKRVGEEGQAH